MKRREFITLLGGAAATWPLAARAQQPTMPVVGFLDPRSPETVAGRLRMFRQGLKVAALPRAKTWPLNTVGQRDNTIGCRRWRQSWCAALSP
jgi:hypothetical protein